MTETASLTITGTLAEIRAAIGAGSAMPGTGTGGTGTPPGPTGATGGTGTPPGPTGPTGVPTGPIIPDVNVYPLLMPPGVTGDSPVTIGTGPDFIEMRLNGNPGELPEKMPQFAVFMDGRVIAGPLNPTSTLGMVFGQIWTIRGSWGPGPHKIELVNSGRGLMNLWVNAMSYNFIPYAYSGGALNTRGGGGGSNLAFVWDNAGVALTWIPAVAAAPGTPPVTGGGGTPPVTGGGTVAWDATPSTITGATVNGAAVSGTLETVLGGVKAGDAVSIPAGTFLGTAQVAGGVMVKGAGMGQTILDCTGIKPTVEKAVIVPTASGTTISDMSIRGAEIPPADGMNAAGIRNAAAGIDVNVTNVELTGNQNGILTNGGSWKVRGCHFHGNGSGDGHTHETYFAMDVGNTVDIEDTNIECGALATHALKSRAKKTKVNRGTMKSNAVDKTGNVAGSIINIPNGGSFDGDGVRLVLLPGSTNSIFFGYAMENADSADGGKVVNLHNFVFDDGTGTGGIIACGGAITDATLDVTGSTHTGDRAPTVQGWKTVIGTIAKAA